MPFSTVGLHTLDAPRYHTDTSSLFERALQASPESPCLWERHVNTILEDLGFVPTTTSPSSIEAHSVLFLRQVDDFACEIILFALPMIRLLRDVSIDGRYIGFVLLIWTFPMSTLLLIIGPKVLAFRRAQAESSGGRRKQPTRGRSLGGVHLSGLSGLTASCDTAIVRTTPPDSQASYVDGEPRGPVNGSHFAE
jgi:hypothetical protein